MGVMSIGPLEILVVALVIVLVWRGPSMLPKLGEALGKTVKGARDNFSRQSDDASTPEDDDDASGQ
jgi:TatA/E family protein of Tat protein translocase